MTIDGNYAFVYSGLDGVGIGMFRVKGTRVIGRDIGDGRYDGTITEVQDGQISMDLTMTIPPGGMLVSGSAPQEIEQTRPIQVTFPPAFGDGKPVEINLAFGPLIVMIKRVPDDVDQTAYFEDANEIIASLMRIEM